MLPAPFLPVEMLYNIALGEGALRVIASGGGGLLSGKTVPCSERQTVSSSMELVAIR